MRRVFDPNLAEEPVRSGPGATDPINAGALLSAILNTNQVPFLYARNLQWDSGAEANLEGNSC